MHMYKRELSRYTLRAALLVFTLVLPGSTIEAQQTVAPLGEPRDSVEAAELNERAKHPRTRYMTTHEQRAPIALAPLFRARGIRNPIIVVDGRVVSLPVPVDIRVDDIDCVDFLPGRVATLEFRRGAQDNRADGVVMIWTRRSLRKKPPGCKVPY